MKTCITHHYSCDCREDMILDLLTDVYTSHIYPDSHEYNECDKEPCMWCETLFKLYSKEELDAYIQKKRELLNGKPWVTK